MIYRKRIADDILKEKLKGKGAVLIQGPKWCGKTTTAEQICKSKIYMNDPSTMKQNLSLAELSPRTLLEGQTPRLIDEWQLAPKLWDAVRFEVDHRTNLGQFILTGSAVPIDTDQIHHSGTGRFSWLTMRTMSLYESGESSGDISLGQLFNSNDFSTGNSLISLEKLAFLVCRGGWPQAVNMEEKIALNQAFDYYDGVINSDVQRADNVSKNVNRVKRLMRSYARFQGSQTPLSEIIKDIQANDEQVISDSTIASYLTALKKIFVIEDMPAWNPNLRSKSAIRTTDTRYYADPSIATAALGLGPKDLINDLHTFGLLFETLAVRDLRIYADSLGGEVYHYRDKEGLECDAVIHLRNGSYGLIEIKLGGETLIEQGICSLEKLSNKIDTTKMKEPSFKMVLTGTGDYAYKRKDNIWIVPIGSLKN